MQTALPPRAFYQVNFVLLSFACMTFHKFISFNGPFRRRTDLEYLFFYLVFFVHPLPGGLRPGMTLCSFPLREIGKVYCADFCFALVLSITMYLEYFLSSFWMNSVLQKLIAVLG